MSRRFSGCMLTVVGVILFLISVLMLFSLPGSSVINFIATITFLVSTVLITNVGFTLLFDKLIWVTEKIPYKRVFVFAMALFIFSCLIFSIM